MSCFCTAMFDPAMGYGGRIINIALGEAQGYRRLPLSQPGVGQNTNNINDNNNNNNDNNYNNNI